MLQANQILDACGPLVAETVYIRAKRARDEAASGRATRVPGGAGGGGGGGGGGGTIQCANYPTPSTDSPVVMRTQAAAAAAAAAAVVAAAAAAAAARYRARRGLTSDGSCDEG